MHVDKMTTGLGTFTKLESRHFIKALLTLQEKLEAIKEKCLHPLCLKPFCDLYSLGEKVPASWPAQCGSYPSPQPPHDCAPELP